MAGCEKKGWASEQAAHRKLKEIRRLRDRSRRSHKIEARHYQCSHCGSWHITSDDFDPLLAGRGLRDKG